MKLDFVDPELIPVLAAWPDAVLDADTLALFRDFQMPFEPLPPPAPQVVERVIPGPADNPRLRVLICDPAPGPAPGTKGRAAILHMHGGGYVMGTADLTSASVQRFAIDVGIPVISVDYRLAPETLWSGSLADNYAALLWLAGEGGTELGIDPARIAVAGESAGGGHAAILAIAARDRGGPAVAFQLLTYPMIDDRTGAHDSCGRPVPDHIGQHVWTAASNRFGWASFLGQEAGLDSAPHGAVPARVENLSGLPPAWIGCGALDLFIEEDLEFARRLVAAGVPTEFTLSPGAFHGFESFAPEARVSAKFIANRLEALKRALGG